MISLRSLRSLATLLSVALAVAGLMASFNYAATAEKHILQTLDALSPELIVISYHEPSLVLSRIEEDMQELRSVLKERVRAVPLISSAATLLKNLRNDPLLVHHIRTSPEIAELLRMRVSPATGFRGTGTSSACMLSEALVPHLSASLPPQGSSLFFHGKSLFVEGVFLCDDTLLGINWSRVILSRFTAEGASDAGDSVRLLLRVSGGIDDGVVRQVENALMRTRNLRMFSIQHFQELLAQKRKVTKAIRLLTETVALIMLLLASIGCMNVFFISVSERTREIGLRRALGATRGEVLFLIMKDCYVFMGAGTLIGLAGGYYVTHALMKPLLMVMPEFRDWTFDVHSEAITKTLVFLLCGATCAGFFPALRAARTDPAVALRE